MTTGVTSASRRNQRISCAIVVSSDRCVCQCGPCRNHRAGPLEPETGRFLRPSEVLFAGGGYGSRVSCHGCFSRPLGGLPRQVQVTFKEKPKDEIVWNCKNKRRIGPVTHRTSWTLQRLVAAHQPRAKSQCRVIDGRPAASNLHQQGRHLAAKPGCLLAQNSTDALEKWRRRGRFRVVDGRWGFPSATLLAHWPRYQHLSPTLPQYGITLPSPCWSQHRA